VGVRIFFNKPIVDIIKSLNLYLNINTEPNFYIMKKIFLLNAFCISILLNLHLQAQSWKQKAKALSLPYNQIDIGQEYGYSVAIDGNYAVVGNIGYEFNAGAAFVLYFDGTNWITLAKLLASDKNEEDFFGYSVGISGNTIVVGARWDDDNGFKSGSAYVFTKPVNGWVDMTQTAKIKPSDGTANDNFGVSVSISGDNIVIGADQDCDNGNWSGSAYVYTKPIIGWVNMTETAKIKPSDGTIGDRFGKSVSISGSNIVIGSPYFDGMGSNVGSAYIFTKPSMGWINMTQTAKLFASTSYTDANFGCSVSISGDIIVIGAKADYNNGTYSGAAYVFSKPSTSGWVTMSATAKLTPYGGTTYDTFGFSVGVSGDNIVVGNYSNNENGYDSGSAYVFSKPVTGWIDMTQTAKIKASDGAASDWFGLSVSISGDNILVGSPQDDDTYTNSGSTYIFKKPVSGWINMTQTQKLIPPDYFGTYCASFGHSFAIDGNYAVLGNPSYNDTGAVYIYYYNGTVWAMQAILTPSDGITSENFGCSVGMSGDNVVIGAWGDNDNGTNSGSSYVFTKPITGWINMTQTAKIKPSDGYIYHRFGNSVSISGDNIVVGSIYDDDNGSNSGSVYVYTKPLSGWANMTQSAKIKPSDGATDDNFGNSLSISGDNIIIGAMNDDDNGLSSGSAYVFVKPISGWTNMTQTAKILPSDGASYDNFGNSVCISGDNVVIGSYNDDDNGINSGSAYIYSKPVSGWMNMNQTAKILPSDGADSSNFGISVSISGDNIVIGSYNNDDNGNNSGSAYVYSKSVSGWMNITQSDKINPIDGDIGDNFGYSVGISDIYILVGAISDDDIDLESGSVYLFQKCSEIGVSLIGNALTSNAIGADYQWLDCNNYYAPILGATNQSFIFSGNGNYAVEVTQNGCTDTSACQNIILGIGDYITIPPVVIYPNPATKTLNIEGLSNMATAVVYDISGKLLLSKQLNENQLDISSLAKGLYFIKLSTMEGSVVRKFVKE
jgi:hypothetical protein